MTLDFNFTVPYVMAMREQAPKMFNELRKSGQMDKILQERGLEASQMMSELLADKPKSEAGNYRPSDMSWAREVTMAHFLDFPKPTHQGSDRNRRTTCCRAARRRRPDIRPSCTDGWEDDGKGHSRRCHSFGVVRRGNVLFQLPTAGKLNLGPRYPRQPGCAPLSHQWD